MKSKILGILCMLMLVVVFVPQNNAQAASVTKSNWYRTVLNSKSGSYKIGSKTYKRSKYKYYKVLDINKDGTKELFLSTYSGGKHYSQPKDSVLVLTYYKKKIKPLKAYTWPAGGYLIYKSSKKTMTYYKRFSDSEFFDFYQLKKGTLSKNMSLGHTWYTNDNYVDKYYKNGKKSTETTVIKYYNQYRAGGIELKYSKIS
ncbi:MAG: hypothetical protein Q4F79_09065 [Eubacteriales bacterium]|nr:hypothetical protein [Eubacteriales bacterium]